MRWAVGHLKLVGCKESAIRETSASIFDIDDAVDSWLKCPADFIQKVCEWAIVGSFLDGLARTMYVEQFAYISFDWIH